MAPGKGAHVPAPLLTQTTPRTSASEAEPASMLSLPSLASCVVPGKLLHVSEPWFVKWGYRSCGFRITQNSDKACGLT